MSTYNASDSSDVNAHYLRFDAGPSNCVIKGVAMNERASIIPVVYLICTLLP